MDSLTRHVPPDKFSTFFLKGNPFLYDRLISSLQMDSVIVPKAGSFRFGMNAYRQYFDMTPQIPVLDTHLAVTDIAIVLGGSREQLLFLNHTQRVVKRLTGQIGYSSLVSPGFLLNSLTKYRGLHLALFYKSRIFNSSFVYQNAKVEADENGGIKPGQEIEGLSKSDFQQLQTFLSNDKRIVKRYYFDFKNSLALYNHQTDDSLSDFNIKVHADAVFLKWGTSYTAVPDTGFYENIYKDSTATKDTSGYHYLKIQPAVGFYFQNKFFNLSVKAGMGIYLLEQVMDTVKSFPDYKSPFLSAKFYLGDFTIASDLSLVICDGINNKDRSVDLSLSYDSIGASFSSINFSAGSAELAVESTSNFYSSNNFIWSNSFEKEKTYWAKASLSFIENQLTIMSGIYKFQNAIYFDETALPVQAEKSAALTVAGINLDISISKWRFLSILRYSNSSEDFIRVPEWGAYARVSFRDRFFKKALLAEFGSSIYSSAEWSAYAFMPATGVMHLQSSQFAGGAPTLDLFFNADIGRATLTFMLQRLNNRFFGDENYIAAGFPAPPRTFKFCVNWRLYN